MKKDTTGSGGESSHVLLLGDAHGNIAYMTDAIRAGAENGITRIIQLGDLGVWPGEEGKRFMDDLEEVVRETGVEFVFIEGNHEDYNQLIDHLAHSPRDRNGGIHVRENIVWQPRGTIKKIEGKTFAFLGGSISVDKGDRVPGESWWKQEEITLHDVDNLENNVMGKKVDVFVTHDVPASVNFPVTPDDHWPSNTLKETHNQRVVLDLALGIVKPSLLVHGHWHTRYSMPAQLDGHTFQVGGYGQEDSSGIGLLNIDTLDLDDPSLRKKIVDSFERRQRERYSKFDVDFDPLQQLSRKGFPEVSNGSSSRLCGALTLDGKSCNFLLVDGDCPHHR